MVVYDSLRRSSRRVKEGVSKFHSVGEKVLMKFQKYLSTFVFFGCEDSSVILQKENYILEKLVYKECPQQENLQDCSLFGLITLIHLANNIEVTYETFNQHHITTFREALSTIFSSKLELDPRTELTWEFIYYFFPKLKMMIGTKEDMFIQHYENLLQKGMKTPTPNKKKKNLSPSIKNKKSTNKEKQNKI